LLLPAVESYHNAQPRLAVCKKVIDQVLGRVDKADYKKQEVVEEALIDFCKGTKKDSKEKKLVRFTLASCRQCLV